MRSVSLKSRKLGKCDEKLCLWDGGEEAHPVDSVDHLLHVRMVGAGEERLEREVMRVLRRYVQCRAIVLSATQGGHLVS